MPILVLRLLDKALCWVYKALLDFTAYIIMKILTKKNEIYQLCSQWRQEGQQIALVPTMGYYHAGHESLMQYAREHAQKVVVSLFVNPKQFGPTEDLSSYPRNLEGDVNIAKSFGVDVVFAPEDAEMYSDNNCTNISVSELNKGLCSLSRPTHFDGVCTVVMKLFLLTQAHMAVFGQKDWQQLAIIKQMVRDLDVPINIVGRPIVRDVDGLALSSRNAYLTKDERAQAPHIYKGLCASKEMAASGEKNAQNILDTVGEYWAKNIPLGQVDYASIVDAKTLAPQKEINNMSLLACAVRMGKARLIDNMLLL